MYVIPSGNFYFGYRMASPRMIFAGLGGLSAAALGYNSIYTGK